MDYAPVIVFAYNRLSHLQKTINALSINQLAKYSDLFIFSDGPKNYADIDKVKEIRVYILGIGKDLFRSIHIFESDINLGLSKSIINGVGQVIEKYGRVIVVEDDVITSGDFLEYMNNALDYYESHPSIWSVGGYTPSIRIPEDYEHDTIAVQRVSSIAWGTWFVNWNKIDWDMSNYNKFRFSFIKRKEFNSYGNDRSSMLDDQMNGRINSWAIRFDYAMWENHMYNILPIFSRVYHIGNDGSGTHSKIPASQMGLKSELKRLSKPIAMKNAGPDKRIRSSFSKAYRVPVFVLVKRYISNMLLYSLANKRGRICYDKKCTKKK